MHKASLRVEVTRALTRDPVRKRRGGDEFQEALNADGRQEEIKFGSEPVVVDRREDSVVGGGDVLESKRSEMR